MKNCYNSYNYFVLIFTYFFQVKSAEAVIQIPGDQIRFQDGRYRLDYSPPQGLPRPNTTFSPEDVSIGIPLTRALPGTNYEFRLYYTNDTINEWPTWKASITTG